MPVYVKARRQRPSESAEIEALIRSYALLIPIYMPVELRRRIAAFAACARTPVFRRGSLLVVVK
jgi:hypothetical protein